MSVTVTQLRREGARHQVAARVAVVADAHVAVAVDHALIGEDPVGGDEILDEARVGRTCGGRRGLRPEPSRGSPGEHRRRNARARRQEASPRDAAHLHLPAHPLWAM